MGQGSSTALHSKKFAEERQNWLQTVSREQVLREFTHLLTYGNEDYGPVVSISEITYFERVFRAALEHDDRPSFATLRSLPPLGSSNSLWDNLSKLVIPQFYSRARSLKFNDNLLGKIFDYHGAYPFPSGKPNRLDQDGLFRAFTLLSGKDSQIFGGERMGKEVLTRKKTESGRRKLLFRSLAVPIETLEGQTQIPNNDGRIDALEDTLDVLSCIQPRLSAHHAPLPRSDLQPTAARLLDPQADIQSLHIQRDDLHRLCMLILAFDSASAVYDWNDKTNHMLEFVRVADWMVQSFCVDGDESGIKWEAFDTVIKHAMPYFWTDFIQVLRGIFSSEQIYTSPQSLFSSEYKNTNPLLILPIRSNTKYFSFPYQLSTFLPRFVHNSLYHPVELLSVSLDSEHPHDISRRQLVDRWRNLPQPSITLISAIPVGQEPRWELEPENAESDNVQSSMEEDAPPFNPFTRPPKNVLLFGAFIATDFFSDTSMDSDAARLLTRSQLFQLAPLQDVFPCRKTQEQPSSWRAFQDAKVGRDGGLRFGAPLGKPEPGGVSLSVDENLEFGEFVHNVDREGVFNPSVALGKRRGNERIKFKVLGIEAVALERKAGKS